MVVVLAFVAYAVALTIALARAGHRPSATPPIMPAASSVTRVLIIGGTGGTGRRLVAQALERGLVVTALARDPARLKIDHPRLTVLRGNVLDAAVVDAAVRGQEAVLCALGHKRFLGPTTILSAGTRKRGTAARVAVSECPVNISRTASDRRAPRDQPARSATLAGFAAILLWSTTVPLARGLTEHVGPVSGAAAVYGVSGALAFVSLVRRRTGRPPVQVRRGLRRVVRRATPCCCTWRSGGRSTGSRCSRSAWSTTCGRR